MNLASYIVLFAVLALVAGVLAYLIRQRRKAKKENGSCAGGCHGCALHGCCGKERQ